MAHQLWALVHAASACERSQFNVATRGRSAEGSELATSFIYVSKVCQPYQLYVLEPASLCVRKCGIASQENPQIGTIWIGAIPPIGGGASLEATLVLVLA